jgi:hypothetical protein
MSDSQDEELKTTYDQLCYSYRAIDDFRAKLLGFLPLASGTGIFLLIPKEGAGPLNNSYLGPIGAFGILITLGLFFYEIYGIKKCHNLIKAGQQLEGQMGIRGQFKERPREVARFINEPFAAGVIYPAVLAAWMFLALQGQEIFKREATDLLIALVVFVVGCLISFAYNRRLGTEKTFLAKLLDRTCAPLDESFFGSHTLEGAHESAQEWAKTVKDAACIQLTDADDVKESNTFKVGAPFKAGARCCEHVCYERTRKRTQSDETQLSKKQSVQQPCSGDVVL